jgi:hypothetical protein
MTEANSVLGETSNKNGRNEAGFFIISKKKKTHLEPIAARSLHSVFSIGLNMLVKANFITDTCSAVLLYLTGKIS